jgi:type VI secretion system secreted protein VgrG
MSVSTPLGTDVLLLEGLSSYEAVSEPFELTLDLLSTNHRIDPDTMLRKGVTVHLSLGTGGQRHFHGIVSRFSQGGRGDRFASYRAQVVPSLWFLTLSTDCRVFQHLSVPDIIQKILKEAGITDVRLSLTGSYAPREYCVQYRESHFAFISRLMEEEGIFYFFEHTSAKHTLVLADATSAVKPGPVSSLRVAASESAAAEFDDVIDRFEVDTLVRPGKVTLVDYNDTQTKRLQTQSVGVLPTSPASFALYDYPGKFDAVSAGDRLAKIRMEAEEATAKIITCTTNSRGLIPGHKLEVVEHYNAELNAPYHLLSVLTSARITNYGSTTAGVDETFTFDARFTAIPYSVPFRAPARTPKSIVHGTQTAVVVGPGGEEIYVDKAGRVKVQFYWDRVGANDENSSCWVRVASTWAGKGWGAIYIPRIGQEVVVEFLEGDPDRPIITGSVYNSEQIVPYTLPDNGTQSGIKSHSSKGGETANTNEFRFEDKKDAEEIYLHAEKDLNAEIKNNETRTVGNDRTTTIKNNETKTVTEGNESTTIEKGDRAIKVSKGNHSVEIAEGDEDYKISAGKQTLTIDKDRKVTINTGNDALVLSKGDLSTSVDMGNVEHTVKMGNVTNNVKMGNVTTKLGLGKQSIEAMQGIELKVGQSSITIDQTGVTIKGMMIKIEGQMQTEVKGLMTQINASGMMVVKGGITMIN